MCTLLPSNSVICISLRRLQLQLTPGWFTVTRFSWIITTPRVHDTTLENKSQQFPKWVPVAFLATTASNH